LCFEQMGTPTGNSPTIAGLLVMVSLTLLACRGGN
jgi:hypothetical protein